MKLTDIRLNPITNYNVILFSTDQLPAKGFLLNCLVQKLEGGSGGPVRVVAYLEDQNAEELVQTNSENSGLEKYQ